jgi:CheY-like chemotaxis protein
MKLNPQQFTAALRSALHYLYELDQLHRSPLIFAFDLSVRGDAALTLQRILLDAIQAMRPTDDDNPNSNAWRLYDLLFFRYVRGYERFQVANQLGISDRQLSREQKSALEALALHLWTNFHMDNQSGSPPAPNADQTSGSWVDALPAEKPSPWKPVLLSVIELLHPLITENHVLLTYHPDENLPHLLVPQGTLRHSLLTLLGWMIPLAGETELILSPSSQDETLVITVDIPAKRFAGKASDAGILVVRQLIERVGGWLAVSEESDPARVRLAIPALSQIPVLVVDDNPDTIQLFQRYAEGTRYSVVGLEEPAEAVQMFERIRPPILVVDVMMPELDGWDLLTQLRSNQQLGNIAIVVCSILPQEGLARSLGADGFLQKPVLPQDFLRLLDRQIERLSQEMDTE